MSEFDLVNIIPQLQSEPIPIADKATAYALNGVAAGTVYKTDDTGQVMEYLGDVLPNYDAFTLAGLSAVDNNGVYYNGTYTFRGIIDGAPTFRCDDAENAAGVPQGFAQDFWLSGETWQTGAWSSGSGLMDRLNVGQEGNYNNYAHPDGEAGAGENGYYNYNGTGADIAQTDFTRTDPASNPFNWKINGVVSVFDNDDKQLLTNLPDTQQVEVTGEGGRIERFNGDNEGVGAIGFGGTVLVTGGTYDPAGAGVQDFAANGAAGEFLTFTPSELGGFRKLGDEYVTMNGFSHRFTDNANNGLGGTVGKWGIYDQHYAGNILFESVEDADTVHPADATWVTVHVDALTVPTFTRRPAAVQENWQVLKNTVYLTVVNAIAVSFDFNKVTVAASDTQGIGWVPVGERLLASTSSYKYKVSRVDGQTAYTLSTDPIEMLSVAGAYTLPDSFPHAALIEITNA